MKILLMEWLTGGGLLLDHQPLEPGSSFVREGAAMANALAADWASAGHEITVLLDHRAPGLSSASRPIRLFDAQAWERALVQEAAFADRVMVIAPETGGRLVQTLAWLEPFRHKLLCPAGEVVTLGSSKHETALRLEAAGVQLPYGRLLEQGERPDQTPEFAALAKDEFLVVKPDDGAGSQGVRRVRRSNGSPSQVEPEALADQAWSRIDQASEESASASGSAKSFFLTDQAGGEGGEHAGSVADASGSLGRGRYRLERLLTGLPVSHCVVAGPAGVWFLPPTRQRFSGESYLQVPSPEDEIETEAPDHELVGDSRGSLRGPRFMTSMPADDQTSVTDPSWPGPWCGFDWPLPMELAERALSLARKAIAALPFFTGPAGLDLILSPSGRNEDRVVDFNPRLTSSWVGLRDLFDANLGAQLLGVVAGAPPPVLVPARAQFSWRLPS